jgi:acyl-CoA thioesterase-1
VRGVWLALALLAAFGCAKNERRSESVSTGNDNPQAKLAPQPSPLTPQAPARRSVLFVGTSITAGLGLEPDSAYPSLIQQKIDAAALPVSVVNAGVSGETTSGLLERLDWLLRAPFDVMVLETGANDGLRGIPAETVRQNIRMAVNRIKAKRPTARIMLVQMEVLPNLGPKYAAQFHAVYPDLAKELGVPLVPFLLDGVAGRSDLNQSDGIHPNQRGERIVADNIWKSLRPVLDSLASSSE